MNPTIQVRCATNADVELAVSILRNHVEHQVAAGPLVLHVDAVIGLTKIKEARVRGQPLPFHPALDRDLVEIRENVRRQFDEAAFAGELQHAAGLGLAGFGHDRERRWGGQLEFKIRQNRAPLHLHRLPGREEQRSVVGQGAQEILAGQGSNEPELAPRVAYGIGHRLLVVLRPQQFDAHALPGFAIRRQHAAREARRLQRDVQPANLAGSQPHVGLTTAQFAAHRPQFDGPGGHDAHAIFARQIGAQRGDAPGSFAHEDFEIGHRAAVRLGDFSGEPRGLHDAQRARLRKRRLDELRVAQKLPVMLSRRAILGRAVVEIPITRQPRLRAGQRREQVCANLLRRALVIPDAELVQLPARRRIGGTEIALAEVILLPFQPREAAGVGVAPHEHAVEIELRAARPADGGNVAPLVHLENPGHL